MRNRILYILFICASALSAQMLFAQSGSQNALSKSAEQNEFDQKKALEFTQEKRLVGINQVIASIEKNNPTLSGLRLDTDAEKIGNRTGIFPANPEAGFNYLWGSPEVINDRKDFSIMQSFDFPTAYGYRNSISRLKNEQAEYAYSIRKKEILAEAYTVCAEIIYRNALNDLLTERLRQAKELAGIYQKRLETGDANILESNKAQLNLLTVTGKLETNERERQALLSELRALNGGNDINFSDTAFPVIVVETDFTIWYSLAEKSNPELQYLNLETSVTNKQQQLYKSLWLPQLSAGYMSESLPGEKFRGVSVGMSIPLWQNRNTVKYAKAKNLAASQFATGSRLLFENRMKAAHTKVISLQHDLEAFRNGLSSLGNINFLVKALNSGQISLSEYLLELTYYYEASDQLLELEYSVAKAYGELIYYRNQ